MAEVNSYYFTPVPTTALADEKVSLGDRRNRWGTLEVRSSDRNRLGDLNDQYFWHTSYNKRQILSPESGRELLHCFTSPAFLENYSQTLLIRSDSDQLDQTEDFIPVTDYEQLSEIKYQWPKISKFCSPLWSRDKTVSLDIILGTASYSKKENCYWPGFDRVFSQLNLNFFKSEILASTAIAMAGFFIGERLVGALSGSRIIGTSCLWVLYSINFTGLILSTIKSGLNGKQKLDESYRQLESDDIGISQRRTINRSIAETKSEMSKKWLYWGITTPLVTAVCYFDKSFLSTGPFKFFSSLPIHFARGIPAALNSLYGVCMTVGSLFTIFNASNLWFETYLGLSEENSTNIAYSVFSMLTLGVALISRASWEMNKISIRSGSFAMKNFSLLESYNLRTAKGVLQSNMIGLPLLTFAGFYGITTFLYNCYADLAGDYSASDAHHDVRRERDRLKVWFNESIF